MRRFFLVPRKYVKTDGKENIYNIELKCVYLNLCIFKPATDNSPSCCPFQGNDSVIVDPLFAVASTQGFFCNFRKGTRGLSDWEN